MERVYKWQTNELVALFDGNSLWDASYKTRLSAVNGDKIYAGAWANGSPDFLIDGNHVRSVSKNGAIIYTINHNSIYDGMGGCGIFSCSTDNKQALAATALAFHNNKSFSRLDDSHYLGTSNFAFPTMRTSQNEVVNKSFVMPTSLNVRNIKTDNISESDFDIYRDPCPFGGEPPISEARQRVLDKFIEDSHKKHAQDDEDNRIIYRNNKIISILMIGLFILCYVLTKIPL